MAAGSLSAAPCWVEFITRCSISAVGGSSSHAVALPNLEFASGAQFTLRLSSLWFLRADLICCWPSEQSFNDISYKTAIYHQRAAKTNINLLGMFRKSKVLTDIFSSIFSSLTEAIKREHAFKNLIQLHAVCDLRPDLFGGSLYQSQLFPYFGFRGFWFK